MEVKIKVKFTIIQIVFTSVYYLLLSYVTRYIPNVRTIRFVEFVIAFIIGIIVLGIIDHYKIKAMKNANRI